MNIFQLCALCCSFLHVSPHHYHRRNYHRGGTSSFHQRCCNNQAAPTSGGCSFHFNAQKCLNCNLHSFVGPGRGWRLSGWVGEWMGGWLVGGQEGLSPLISTSNSQGTHGIHTQEKWAGSCWLKGVKCQLDALFGQLY